MSITMIGSGDEFSLLRDCAKNCVDNGGEWYTAPQMLAILGDHVSNPALMGDAAFISMAEPERVLRILDQLDELLTALRDVIGWIPGDSAWFTDAPRKAVERARAVIATTESAQP